MRRDTMARFLALVGCCALGGSFYYYTLFGITARMPAGEPLIRDIAAGRGPAPYQYRMLIPSVVVWLNHHASLSLAQSLIIVEGVALAVGTWAGLALLRRAHLELFSLPALLYVSVFAISLFDYPAAETTTAFACTTVALWALGRDDTDSDRWPPWIVWIALGIAGTVLIGTRTDMLVALSAGFAVRWLQRRQREDIVAAVLLGVVGAVATIALIRHYPDARYASGVDVVQLRHNLSPGPITVMILFLAPVLGPLWSLVGAPGASTAVHAAATRKLPLLAVVATELAESFVAGQIKEARLLFPLAFGLAWVGIDLWRAAATSIEWGRHADQPFGHASGIASHH